MNKKQYKFLWVVVQVFLFIFPIIIALIITPYKINRDQHYVNTVYDRAFEFEDGKVTDFSEAVVKKYDAEGQYEDKVWKLKNKEVYYFINIGIGILLGMFFQVFNLLWNINYDFHYDY